MAVGRSLPKEATVGRKRRTRWAAKKRAPNRGGCGAPSHLGTEYAAGDATYSGRWSDERPSLNTLRLAMRSFTDLNRRNTVRCLRGLG